MLIILGVLERYDESMSHMMLYINWRFAYFALRLVIHWYSCYVRLLFYCW